MTDIEVLRDAVIEAARQVCESWERNGMHTENKLLIDEEALLAAVDALDAALEPDPWALLKEARRCLGGDRPALSNRIDDALAWRAKQEDAS